VEAELFHADGHTDRQTNITRIDRRYDEATSRFSQFCETLLKILRSAHGVNCVFRLHLRLIRFMCITEIDSVYCAVRNGSLNKTAYGSSLRDSTHVTYTHGTKTRINYTSALFWKLIKMEERSKLFISNTTVTHAQSNR
jgi:hypothetical protein